MSDIIIRKLESADLDSGFLESLDSLRSASKMNPVRVREIFDIIESKSDYCIFIAQRDDKIIGTATLIVEQKFIHNGGLVGHIEDVAVNEHAQNTGIGKALVEKLVSEARSKGCYKVILDCSDELVAYYERCGLKRHSVIMRKNLD